jgi:hypothetical protein
LALQWLAHPGWEKVVLPYKLERVKEGRVCSSMNMVIRTLVAGMAIALQTAEDFRKRLNEVLSQLGYDIGNERFPEGYQEAPLAYDAIWAVALGEACAYLPFLLFQLYSVIFIYICTMLFQLE